MNNLQFYYRQRDLTNHDPLFQPYLHKYSFFMSPDNNLNISYCQQLNQTLKREEMLTQHQQKIQIPTSFQGRELREEQNDKKDCMVELESQLSEYFVRGSTQQNEIDEMSQWKEQVDEKSKTENKKICCNCEQSKCLKRYCPCFHNDVFCTNCSCMTCLNNNDNFAQVERARMHVFQKCHRKKHQPREKLMQSSVSYGCSCKKTNCTLRYCECLKRGQACDKKCKCVNCKNIGKPLTSQTIDNQRQILK